VLTPPVVRHFAELPMLCQFPYPVQQLIVKELRVLEDEDDGDLVPHSNVGDETSVGPFYK
jgi:hypothetical protein